MFTVHGSQIAAHSPLSIANAILLHVSGEIVSFSEEKFFPGMCMHYDPLRHHRRSIRLRGYDYSQAGEHFVTICAFERECVLGEITNGAMMLSSAGEIAKRWWDEIPCHCENVESGEYVMMPNHVHGVISIWDILRGDDVPRRSPTLGQIVAFYKYQSTKLINAIRDAPGTRFWQRNYYEHIIRDGNDLARIRKYITDNVSGWSEEKENLKNDLL